MSSVATDPHHNPAIDELRWKKFPLGSHGYVCLVDAMGTDAAIAQSARVCYGAGTQKVHDDEGLLRYLLRHRHTTPFEMCEVKFLVKVPFDAWRQWIRHRTACLSGDTQLIFDLPGGVERRGNQLYPLTVKEVYDRFQPTANTQRPEKQGNPYFKRDRVQNMLLRGIDEATLEPRHTRIVDIWESGVKRVYTVDTRGGSLTMSGDHLCFTDQGWKPLRDIVTGLVLTELPVGTAHPCQSSCKVAMVGPGYASGVTPRPNAINEDEEEWRPIVGWEDYYEVSDQGRVRRIVGGRGSRSHGRCKVITVSDGRAVTSLNRPGVQRVVLVHRVMLRAFVGEPGVGLEACHEDGNSLNNIIENLRWGAPQSNANDRVRDGATTALATTFVTIDRVGCAGEEMTYDLEVSGIGPYHNFVAGGVVVHNSVNEYSTRYSEAIDDRAATPPDKWRLQSTDNRQGSSGLLEEWPGGELAEWATHPTCTPGEYLTAQESAHHAAGEKLYKERLAFGIAREQARKDLPLSTYTEAYWKIDLHNLLHYLSLRMDSHAQLEIRSYADVIGKEIVSKLFPITWQAFLDYRLNAMALTALDQKVIRALMRISRVQSIILPFDQDHFRVCQPDCWVGLAKCRERDECIAKLFGMRILDFSEYKDDNR